MPRPSFESIRDLARTVQRGLPERGQIVTRAELHDSKNLESELFNALIESPILSEQAIAQRVFGTSPVDSKYKFHKSKLKDRLLNTIFVLDLDRAGYTEPTKARLRNDRAAFLAQQIISFGNEPLARSIAEEALQDALAIEAWPNAMACADILRSMAVENGKEALRRHYSEIYFRCAEIELAEQCAADSFSEIMTIFVHSGKEHFEAANIAEAALPAVEEAFAKHGTYGLAVQRFRLQTAAFQARQQYRETIAICDEYAGLLADRFAGIATQDERFRVASKLLHCYLELGESEDARNAVLAAQSLIPHGANNWFQLREMEFLLAMHSGAFKQARNIHAETVQTDRFQVLSEARHERWQVFGIHLDYGLDRIPRFKSPQELLKQLKVYTKDKGGFHASLLVLQILLVTERFGKDKISGLLDAIKKYRSRYLLDGGNAQVNLFFQILETIADGGPSIHKTLEDAAPLIAEFRASSAPLLDGVQILPFKWIWDRLEKALLSE